MTATGRKQPTSFLEVKWLLLTRSAPLLHMTKHVTEIHLGFASSRLYEKGGELHYDMWPAIGTQMMMPVRGAISGKRVVRNTDEELVLAKGVLRYTFRFSPRQEAPDKLRYKVKIFGFIPIGECWGDISSDGKRALRAAFSHHNE